MSASCGHARRHLWPDDGPRPATPDVIDARRHLEECEDCRRFLHEMRTMAEAIRAAAPRDRAPADVRRRLFTAVARERAGSATTVARARHRRRLAAAGIVLAVLAGGVSVHLALRDGARDPIALIAADHARAFGETRLASSDPAEIERWVEEQALLAVHVPTLPGATLRGVRLGLVDGQRGAVIEYDVGDVSLSYFILPDSRDAERAEGTMPRFETSTRSGYGTVTWRDPGLLYVMVARLPESRLATYARTCVEQARAMAALFPMSTMTEEA